MSKLHQFIIALALVAFVIVMRLVPHPANVAPVAAAALFAGAYLSKRWAFTVPVIAMLVSDMVIGFYEPAVMLSVYACLVFSSVLGSYTLSLRGARRATRQSRSLAVIVLATLTGSITFFIVTNFAVWAASSWYPHTLAGFLENYTLALPFFRNTLLGDLFFAGVFFGVAEVVFAFTSRYKKEPVASV